MLVKDEVLLEALKASQHEPPRTARVAEEPKVGGVAATDLETPREADGGASVAEPISMSQGELGL